MTGQSECRVCEVLVKALEHVSLDHLRKIVSVRVSEPDRVVRGTAGLMGEANSVDDVQ